MSHHSSVVVIPCSGIGKAIWNRQPGSGLRTLREPPSGRHRPRCAVEACSWRTRRTGASPQQTGGHDRRL